MVSPLDSLRKIRTLLQAPETMTSSVRGALVQTRTKLELKKRLIALLCGAFLGPGTGHVFLGRYRRAMVWWIATPSTLLLVVANASRIGETIGYDFVVPMLVGLPCALWLASVIDLFIVKRDNYLPIHVGWALLAGAVSLATAVVMPTFLNAYFIQAERVPSTSMLPALVVGDHIVIDKRSKDFRRGNVVVFPFPESPEHDFVKRVVGVSGDTIRVDEMGAISINDWPVPRCRVGMATWHDTDGEHSGDMFVEYLDASTYLTLHETKQLPPPFGPYRVGQGEAFVLGDNRFNSYDSRFWYGTGSGVSLGSITGKALFRWITFEKGEARSDRIGTPLSQPMLPAEMKALSPALGKCLASRPSREKSTPPAPKLPAPPTPGAAP